MFDPYAHLVYTVGRDDVRSVMIDGEFVMRDRALATLDESAIVAEARDLGERIAEHAATVGAATA